MGLLHLAIAALAATAVLAADPPCKCVNPDQVYNSISAPLMFFQQPTEDGTTSGKTCSMSCTFTAKLDVDDPLYSLQIQVLATNKLGDGMLQYTGTNAVNNVINSNTPPGVLPDISYGDTITITFTEGATNLGEFMLVVQKVKGRADPPIVKTTSLAPPTAPYDPKFTHNPRLVANDIMLVFDLSSNDIAKFKTFAQNIINELTINPKSLDNKDTEDCGVGSRLSLVGLSGLSGFTNLYAPYWTTTAEQAIGNIGSFVQMGSDKFFWKPVDTDYIYGFDIANGENNRTFAYTNCTNKEKLFVLFTSNAPQEFKKADPSGGGVDFTDFVNRGVHQILVRYNMTEDDKFFYNNTKFDSKADANRKSDSDSNIWNTFELNGGDKDIENFFNTFLVDAKEPMTCQPISKEKKIDVPIGKADTTIDSPVKVNIPPYYNAKGLQTNDWETKRHYCNFQETTVRLIADETIKERPKPVRMCIKVFYDLETGKDYVSIFSGDPNQPALQEEVVRLTGRDVSGTTFELPDALGSIVFSSDEKNVYDGLHAEIYPYDATKKCEKA